jgi:hypothetical protein
MCCGLARIGLNDELRTQIVSYDLMVFEPSDAPSNRALFLEWYRRQTQWGDTHGYNDPTVSAVKLRSWFLEIIQRFPPLNGPLSTDELPEDEDSVTDYSLGKSVIYCSFAWSKAEQAHSTVFELAQKHGVGFFDVSSNDAKLWFPDDGQLRLMH